MQAFAKTISAEFWQESVFQRLRESFAKADKMDVGEYKGVSFHSDSEDPYTYIVAVKTEDKKLYLVEIYYPKEDQKNRYHPDVLDALGGK